jgi:hypothetical protein
MKLFCWILDKSASPFPVDIEESGSVGDLKKAMVKENPNMFGNVDAPQLKLWKVSGSFPLMPVHLIRPGSSMRASL